VLKRRLGYSTVGQLVAWLAVIAIFAAFYVLIAWSVPPD
jgi:hypothetical protein